MAEWIWIELGEVNGILKIQWAEDGYVEPKGADIRSLDATNVLLKE